MDTLTVPDGHQVTTYRVGAEPALRTSDGKAWLAHLVASSDDTERELLGESTSRVMRARPAMSRADSIRQTVSIVRRTSVDMAARTRATA